MNKRIFIIVIIILSFLINCTNKDEIVLRKERIDNYILLCKKIKNENTNFELKNFINDNDLIKYEDQFKDYGFTKIYFYDLNKKIIHYYSKIKGINLLSDTEQYIMNKTDQVKNILDNPLISKGEENNFNESFQNIQKTYNENKKLINGISDIFKNKKDMENINIISQYVDELDIIFINKINQSMF